MKYSRLLLKLSGESLQGARAHGIDFNIINYFANEIKQVSELGTEIAIVIGGGNIFRGLPGTDSGVDRYKGDQMGMLATVINSLALENGLLSAGLQAKVFTSIKMSPVGEFYHRDEVVSALEKNIICLLAGGTGNPFFTTDTAAALRAVETRSDLLLKGTRVDGIYSADPEKDKKAVRYESISYDQIIEDNLRVMDLTAITLCKENRIPVVVFDMNRPGNLLKIVNGEKIGSVIS